MTPFFFLYSSPFTPVYEGEGSDPPAPETADDPIVTTPEPTETKLFDQTQLNKIVAEERRKKDEALKKALGEIDALKARSSLTEKERLELEERLQTVRNEALTKEQLAKKKQSELQSEYEKRIQSLESQAKEWEDRYINTTIQRSLVDAAAKNKAYSPEQIVYILKDNTRVTQELDEAGQPTGNYVTKVKLEDVDPQNKKVMLELSPDDAVARMRELDKYKNLFQAEGSGGLGLLSSPPSKKVDLAELARNPEAFRKARKDGTLKY
jgi:cob(I)alamin adenosyltransferase